MDDQAARDGIAAAMESKGTDLFKGSGYASEVGDGRWREWLWLWWGAAHSYVAAERRGDC